MKKKIAIFLLIFIIIAVSAGIMVKNKLEREFEQFIMAEVQRKADAEVKALEEQMIAREKESEAAVKVAEEAEKLGENSDNIDATEAEQISTEDSSKNENIHNDQLSKKDSVEDSSDVSQIPKEEVPKEEVPKIEVPESISKETYESDKAKAMSLALKRLSLDQLQRLMEISKGGFTAEERKEAKEMFYGNFTKEEQEWILGIYEDYYLKK